MSVRSSNTTATASGVRAACAANSAGRVAGATGCVVSFQAAQDGVALGALQDRQVAQRLCGVRHRGLQQPDEAPADGLHVRPLEQVGPIVEPQLQRLARLHDQRQRIMRRIAAMDLAELQAVAGCAKSRRRKPGAVDRIVLEHQERVEQVADPGRLLDLGQPQMLVRHQPRLAVLGLPQQRRQRKLRRQLQPQRQRVDEQPHHVLDAGKLRRTARNRHAEHHVVAAAQPAEQDAPRGLHHGVQRQRLLARGRD